MTTPSQFARMYKLNPDRVVFTLTGIERELADGGDGLEEVRAHLRRTVEFAEEAQALEARYKGSRGNLLFGAKAKRLDAELDRALGALDMSLELMVRAFGADSPRAVSATRVREQLFPHGVGNLTHLPYVEEAQQVASLLARVDGDPELQAAIEALNAVDMLERVREVHGRFAEELHKASAPPPSFEEVEQARDAVHDRYCAVALLIVCLCALSDPDSAEAQALSGAKRVVAEQNRAVGIAWRRRRRGGSADDEDEEAPPTDIEAETPVAEPPALPAFDAGFEDEAAA